VVTWFIQWHQLIIATADIIESYPTRSINMFKWCVINAYLEPQTIRCDTASFLSWKTWVCTFYPEQLKCYRSQLLRTENMSQRSSDIRWVQKPAGKDPRTPEQSWESL
jgi:hypothetical protein